MFVIAWECLRHPLSDGEIDLATGRVVRRF